MITPYDVFMTQKATTHYRTWYTPHHASQDKINVVLGVAFEIENPIKKIVSSFFGVLTAPVEAKIRQNLIVRR